MRGLRGVGEARQEFGNTSTQLVSNDPDDPAVIELSSREMSELTLGRLIHDGAFVARPVELQARSVALLLALHAEVTRVAVLTAICASAANVLRGKPDERAARALIRFYPVGSSRFILASVRYCRLDPSSSVAKSLHAFNDALAIAMVATVQFTAAHQAADDPASSSSAAADLCASWQSACASAYPALAEIDDAIGRLVPIGRADESDALVAVLKEAAAGGAPLCGPDGAFMMPAWVEQRQSPRSGIACNARLVDGADEAAINITDVSTGGLGIETSKRLREGEIVTIDLGQVVLPGRVVWCARGRAGIVFEQGLLDDSPEYRFLSSHLEFC